MNIHLITTDESAFQLVDALSGTLQATCVIVPSNRQASGKIARVRAGAERRGIPVSEHRARSCFDSGLPPAEAAVSWLYSQLIKAEDLQCYSRGILNMHGGRIPEYRGASVLQWAMVNGETEMGITWHEMVEEVDAGTIWAESTVPVPPEATALEMRQTMIRAGCDIFPVAWRNFLSRTGGRRPNLSGGRVWPQRRPDDGRIVPGLTERQVRDMVRALCPPWPPAFVEQGGERIAVSRVTKEPAIDAIPYHTDDGAILYLVPGKMV